MYDKPIDWARKYAATMNDYSSLRNMRMIAMSDLAPLENARTEIVERHGEHVAVDEWDSVFAQDMADSREAIRLIEARLEQLGLGWSPHSGQGVSFTVPSSIIANLQM